MTARKILTLLLIYTLSLYGQESVRVAAYNVKQYPSVPNADGIAGSLKIVLNKINPTILMATELDGSYGENAVIKFRDNVLSSKYKASTEVNITWGYGNECAVFYIDSLLTYLGSNMIPADTRPIAEFRFVHKFTNDTLIVFGVHLKAKPEETARRLSAVNSLRNRTALLKPWENYLVVGDFNIFTSAEPAFQKLLDQSSGGYFYDPQNATGNWTDNPSFAHTHTYSPSYLKSRLDMILYSQALKDKGRADYKEDSYKIFGNDGAHFAKSVTNGSNAWFSDISIGSALISASDHLPVYADFDFGVVTNIPAEEEIPFGFELMQNYPNPFNPETVISYRLPAGSYVSLKVFDLLGREVAVLINKYQNAGVYNSQFSIIHYQLSSGIYFYRLSAGTYVETKKMVLIK
ncbi:MAG: T9SS type A sorting domain-containing protein [Melioribacteraceae bacterium]